jgi:hypothetical protein
MPSPISFSSVVEVGQYVFCSLVSILNVLTLPIHHSTQTFDIVLFSLDRIDYRAKIIVKGKRGTQKPLYAQSTLNLDRRK